MNSSNQPDQAAAPDPLEHMEGAHIVVVEVGQHDPPRYRRRVFLSLAPAERAVQRATAEGRRATMALYKLTKADNT